MSYPRAYLEELADKWVKGNLTPEEAHVLMEWYNSHDDSFQEVNSIKGAQQDEITEIAFRELIKRIHEEEISSITRSTAKTKKKHYYLPYAASIFVMTLISGIYYYKGRADASKVVGILAVHNLDIAPGGNKAILKLANGAKIKLDGSKNSVQVSNGKLTYNDGSLVKIPVTSDSSIAYHSLITPRGGQYQIILSDGTKVWLNSATTFVYPTKFTGNKRVVKINGEAYFEVAKSENMPFIVISKKQQINVIGTSFCIKAYDDEINERTVLSSGMVKITIGGTTETNSKSQLLIPGQQAVVGDYSMTVSNADVQSALAWKSGIFQFKKTSFEDIMKQLARWYDLEIIYKRKIPQESFTGTMDKNVHLSTILKILDESGIEVRIKDKKIIIE
ncbi:FecR family protein [bacterium A37T11]|nr:FecR family protein [bacterium A37T11]